MKRTHPRNTEPMRASPRCGAKTVLASPADHLRYGTKSAAACMAARRDRGRRAATTMRKRMDSVRTRRSPNVVGLVS
jgi:hypothetical protein